mmetsp:Transcript_58233/g.103398  ORF Transcript_58233/g.103398 Transcript_58233/m.103398 type:complete len:379 (-) Transcript_58233:62-1198(-)
MSQARHVNCKWQSLTTRPPADGLGPRKPEKEKKDKLSLIPPPGLHKDDIVRYFKKYGKVKASHDVGDKFVVQFSSIEPVDLAIELQELSDHKVGKVTFQVERFEPTDEELQIWLEQCDSSDNKRKAPAAIDVRQNKFGRRPMADNGNEPKNEPSQSVEKNANGHLVGCECVRCYHMTRAANMIAEQQTVVAAMVAAAVAEEEEAEEEEEPEYSQDYEEDSDYFDSEEEEDYYDDGHEDNEGELDIMPFDSVTIPYNQVDFVWTTDGDGSGYPKRRWGFFAVAKPAGTAPLSEDKMNLLVRRWKEVSSLARGVAAGKISVEPEDWDEARLRALCARHGWEFEWMTEEGERQRRIDGARLGRQVATKKGAEESSPWWRLI